MAEIKEREHDLQLFKDMGYFYKLDREMTG
jgi:hypothetical protein